jgi:hypothetical protein
MKRDLIQAARKAGIDPARALAAVGWARRTDKEKT